MLGFPKPSIGNQVKHLFIILSLLLLSSFLITCEKKEETLYQWKTSSGYEWKEIGDKDTQIQYRGFVDDGYPEGLGVLTFPDGQKYVGEFKDGEKNGQGTETFPDGYKYVGEYKDGLPNGQGTETWSDGRKYVGEYKDGKQNGQGTFTTSNGTKYVGEWKNGITWNGTLYDKVGNIIGKFVNGKKIKQ